MQAIESLPYSEKYGKAWMKRVEKKKKSRKPKQLTKEEKHQKILDKIVFNNNIQEEYKTEVNNDTPLICYVANKGDLEALKVLIEEQNEEVNQMDIDGQTPFMISVYFI